MGRPKGSKNRGPDGLPKQPLTTAERSRRYYSHHSEKVKVKVKKWQQADPKRYKQMIAESGRRRRKEAKEEIVKLYGGKCKNPQCNERDMAVLSMDHINDDGTQDRKADTRIKKAIYLHLLSEYRKSHVLRADLQILCMNCQFRKRAYGRDFSLWPRYADMAERTS